MSERGLGESPWVTAAIWAVAIGCTALTLGFSLGPAPPGEFASDRELHAIAYFVNTLAILLAVIWRPGRRAGRPDGWVFLIAAGMAILGGVVEVLQAGVGRDAQLPDWVADIIGIALAVVVFVTFRRAFGARVARSS
jgi:VanZ family protein